MAPQRTSRQPASRPHHRWVACLAVLPLSGICLTAALASVRYANPHAGPGGGLTASPVMQTESRVFIENCEHMQEPWSFRTFEYVRESRSLHSGQPERQRIPGYLIAMPDASSQSGLTYRAFSRVNPASGTLLSLRYSGPEGMQLVSPCSDKARFDLKRLQPLPAATEAWQVGPQSLAGAATHPPCPLPVVIDARGDIYITGAPFIGAIDPASPSGWRSR